jgi:aminopeptidase N
MAHPVRPDSYQEINNFYTATVYEKGAEVVRMMHTLVGREGFRRGMDLYFERHDGQAVTCDDFAQAIADANPGSALANRLEAFQALVRQAGTPRLRPAASTTPPALHADAEPATPAHAGQPDKLPQRDPGGAGPAGARRPSAAAAARRRSRGAGTERVLVLTEADSRLHLRQCRPVEPVPSLLRGFSAPVVLDDGLADADLLVLLATTPTPSTAGRPASAWRWTALLARAARRCAPLLDDAFLGDAPRAARPARWTPPSRNWC